ncbi:MAG: FeoA family protein [Betaproteobacteria bacterium]
MESRDCQPIALVHVRAGQEVQVIEILGGHGLVGRLEALGIRPGTRMRKISSVFLRGPVTVEVHDTKVAMGYGMAAKVLVRPLDRVEDEEGITRGEGGRGTAAQHRRADAANAHCETSR